MTNWNYQSMKDSQIYLVTNFKSHSFKINEETIMVMYTEKMIDEPIRSDFTCKFCDKQLLHICQFDFKSKKSSNIDSESVISSEQYENKYSREKKPIIAI